MHVLSARQHRRRATLDWVVDQRVWTRDDGSANGLTREVARHRQQPYVAVAACAEFFRHSKVRNNIRLVELAEHEPVLAPIVKILGISEYSCLVATAQVGLRWSQRYPESTFIAGTTTAMAIAYEARFDCAWCLSFDDLTDEMRWSQRIFALAQLVRTGGWLVLGQPAKSRCAAGLLCIESGLVELGVRPRRRMTIHHMEFVLAKKRSSGSPKRVALR